MNTEKNTLIYTPKRPTEPGWYWVKLPGGKEEPLEIFIGEQWGKEKLIVCAYDDLIPLEDPYFDEALFAGPLRRPVMPRIPNEETRAAVEQTEEDGWRTFEQPVGLFRYLDEDDQEEET